MNIVSQIYHKKCYLFYSIIDRRVNISIQILVEINFLNVFKGVTVKYFYQIQRYIFNLHIAVIEIKLFLFSI